VAGTARYADLPGLPAAGATGGFVFRSRRAFARHSPAFAQGRHHLDVRARRARRAVARRPIAFALVPALIATAAVVGVVGVNASLSTPSAGATTLSGTPAVPPARDVLPDEGLQNTSNGALGNGVVATAPGGNCPSGATSSYCTVPVRSYSVCKSVSEAAADPGDTVTYTITVTNTGQIAYTAATPASFTDDLTKVLDDAKYNADAKATSGTTAYSTANVLSWSGPLTLGQVVTVTYSVLVDDPDNGDLQLVNAVVTPTGGNCLSGSTLSVCKTTVSDVVPVVATPPSGGLAFTGVTAGTQLGFALLAFLLGFGLLLLARRRRESARSS
jgi:uncharacterized repeat protein (TIGR01451 family)